MSTQMSKSEHELIETLGHYHGIGAITGATVVRLCQVDVIDEGTVCREEGDYRVQLDFERTALVFCNQHMIECRAQWPDSVVWMRTERPTVIGGLDVSK